jgi:hypothetical protein
MSPWVVAPEHDYEIRFPGWLGLLKTLREVTGAAGGGAPGG